MVFPFLAGFGALAWGFVQDRLTTGVVVAAVVLVLVGIVLVFFRSVVLEFGPEGAAFGFSRPKRRVSRDRIVAAEVETYDVARYMGWGYRLGWKPRDRAYSVLGAPRGVRLTFDDEQDRRWSVFVSSREPEAAVAALDLPAAPPSP